MREESEARMEQRLREQREEQQRLWDQERQRMVEAEQQRAEADRQRYEALFGYIQGLGTAINYQPPATVPWPPPAPPPPMMAFLPAPAAAVTPVSMNQPCIRLH